MRLRFLLSAFGLATSLAAQPDIKDIITGTYKPPVIAVPDLRGAGAAQSHMSDFNATLFADLQDSGAFKMAPKSMYPLAVPQRPEEFKPPVGDVRQGPWLTDWSKEPVGANYLTLGYTAQQNNRLVLFGWLFNVNQPDVANAQLVGKIYFGDLSADGAKKVAHEFAADILAYFGIKSLFGTKIYYTHQAGPVKDLWVMEFDGSGKRALTRLNSITSFASVSPDGSRLAYTTWAEGNPRIKMMSLETGRILPFFNQDASVNSMPEFTSDSRILFSSTAHGKYANLYVCNLDGSGLRRISVSSAIEVEPKINPKTGSELVFTSGRSGPAQIYKMNLDGADVTRLTPGDGEATNPAWHPDGHHIAFSWTKGYDPGNFNIFVMDVATKQILQLTHGAGRNENPSWAPDGRHLVFSSNRGGTTQIYSMLANGTQVRQLTFEGRNERPVWGR